MFNYDSLMSHLPTGKSKDDFVWGVRVRNNTTTSLSVNAVRGQNANHQVFFQSQTPHTLASGESCLLALESDGVRTNYTVTNGLLQVNDVPMPETKQLSITPFFGCIENYGQHTFFIVGTYSDNNEAMFSKLKSGEYSMRVVLTDETARKRYTIANYFFTYPTLEFYQTSFLRLDVCKFGVVPVYGHRYTLQLDLYDAGYLVYHGVSATGAFDRFNEAFVNEGPIIPNPVPYTCLVEDY